MKSTKELTELRSKDDKALFVELSELNKKLTQLEFGVAFRKLKNFHEITNTRKKIARIWTIVNERATEKLIKELAKEEMVNDKLKMPNDK